MKYFLIILLTLNLYCIKGSVAQIRQSGPYTAENYCDTSEINEYFSKGYNSNPIKGNLRGYGNDSAIIFYKVALDCCLKILDNQDLYLWGKRKMASIYRELGMNYGAGNGDKKIIAIEYFKNALTVYEELSDKKSEIEVLNFLKLFFPPNSQERQYYSSKSIATAFESRDNRLILGALSNRGSEADNTDTARYYYFKALRIAEEYYPNEKKGIITRIGRLYEKEKNYSKAREYYQKVSLNEDIGNTYYAEGNFSLAREYYLNELNNIRKTGNKSYIEVNQYYNIATTFISQRNYQDAIEILLDGNLKYESISKSLGKLDLVKQVCILEPLTKSYFLLASSLKESDIDKNKYYLKAILSMKEVTQLSKEIQDTSLVLFILNYRNELFTKYNIKENINKSRFKKNGQGHFELNNDFVNDLGIMSGLLELQVNYENEIKDTINEQKAKNDSVQQSIEIKYKTKIERILDWGAIGLIFGVLCIVVLVILIIARQKLVRKNREIINSAIKAAISQVMSRNMSHNIGSHVLEKLANEKEIITDLAKPFLKYLQTRMEFIADIITTDAVITLDVHFNDDIKEHFISSDAKNNDIPTYLLKYISGSNEIRFCRGIVENICVELEDKKSYVALPNDVLGAQAFYVILENIIRNSVKHSRIPSESENGGCIKMLKLTIKRDEIYKSNDLIKYVIWDNLGKENNSFREKTNFKCGDKVRSFDKWLQDKIDRSILNSRGKLREGSWGMLEMKICAAYLRKHPLEKLDKVLYDINTPPLITCVLDREYNLGYEFFLLKPKLACVVLSDRNALSKKNELENIGVHVATIGSIDHDYLSKYGTLKENGRISEHKISHQYLIIDDRIPSFTPDSNQIFIRLKEEEIKDIFSDLDIHKVHRMILEKLWGVKSLALPLLVNGTTQLDELQKHSIVFDDHAQFQRYHCDLLNKELYYEPYSSQSPTHHIIKKFLSASGDERCVLNFEMNIAALLKVGILDERIQDEAKEMQQYDGVAMKIQKILERMRIYVPEIGDNKSFDLYANSYRNGIGEKVIEWMNNMQRECDYIIIHQGVIEKTIGDTDPRRIKEDFINKFSNSKSKIVIISGRGKPSNLPGDVYYLPFSIVNQYVMTYRSKIYLYKLLISTRRYRNG